MSHLIETIKATQAKFDTVPEEKKLELVTSMLGLTKKLVADLSEFTQIPKTFEEQHYPQITQQLAAAEKRTDVGIDKIMSAAEAIMKLAGDLDAEPQDKIMKCVNVIFEAASMQDLVAQHLNEIKLCLDDLQEDFQILDDFLSDKDSENQGRNTYAKKKAEKAKRSDSHLLNGPPTDV